MVNINSIVEPIPIGKAKNLTIVVEYDGNKRYFNGLYGIIELTNEYHDFDYEIDERRSYDGHIELSAYLSENVCFWDVLMSWRFNDDFYDSDEVTDFCIGLDRFLNYIHGKNRATYSEIIDYPYFASYVYDDMMNFLKDELTNYKKLYPEYDVSDEINICYELIRDYERLYKKKVAIEEEKSKTCIWYVEDE